MAMAREAGSRFGGTDSDSEEAGELMGETPIGRLNKLVV
jgi:hypothetical protein